MTHGRILLEVALESADEARIAEAAGADRIELCTALDVGGLTPTVGAAGGFDYSADERKTMHADIEAALESGAAGVVFGVLDANFEVDRKACAELVARCAGRPAVFHRAIDLTPDPLAAADAILDCGFRRILTSGQRPTVVEPEAMALVRRLVEHVGGRIEILPGSGVRAATAAELVRTTGCRQVHGAFRRPRADSGLRERGVRFGFGVPGAGDRRTRLDAEQLQAVREALDQLT
ncbi:MAG: copper homeostasis protein CutC [Planctomycetes bacterium]|nr:copper homeostasis protein CutC [Planctomycetota bacterium]